MEGGLNPTDLRRRFEDGGQGHVFRFWDDLDDAGRRSLLADCQRVDLDLVRRLVREHLAAARPRAALPRRIEPAEFFPARRSEEQTAHAARAHHEGLALLREGRVAALLVAGGQASRLGTKGPKGCYPVGPVSGESLYAIHAGKIARATRRFGRPIPWCILTSQATDGPTRTFFREHDGFGLPAEHVHFFTQGSLPAVTPAGKIVLRSRSSLLLSPDGHGGVLPALRRAGLLDRLADQGITHVFFFQVDNPLVRMLDPTFLGLPVLEEADLALKVVPKRTPEEKMGVLCRLDGRAGIIEYSDLPRSLAEARDEQGRLLHRAGSIATHVFRLAFLRALAEGDADLPFHVARKQVEGLDTEGHPLQGDDRWVVKFESFIFDVFPRADRVLAMEVRREEEFEPLKNREGDHSPEVVRAAISREHTRWLREARIAVPPGQAVEISPSFAMDLEDLLARADSIPASALAPTRGALAEGIWIR